MPRCKKCNAEFIEGDKFCPSCGSKIIKRNNNCIKCGNKISPDDKFCGSCGSKTTNKQDDNQVEYENINNIKKQSSFHYSSFDYFYYKQVLEKYSDFSGRSTRAEYWYFVLYNTIIALLILIFGAGIGDEVVGILYVLYLFVMLIPFCSVSVRRLHDIGKSGWMLLISLIPLIGFAWMLILFITVGDVGTNKYGPNPKNV